MSQPRISATRDVVQKLETDIKELTERAEMAESRSRYSNLGITYIPERATGEDACAFLESWLPDVLGLVFELCRSSLIIERAHCFSGSM